jgi:hypothetical protein
MHRPRATETIAMTSANWVALRGDTDKHFACFMKEQVAESFTGSANGF